MSLTDISHSAYAMDVRLTWCVAVQVRMGQCELCVRLTDCQCTHEAGSRRLHALRHFSRRHRIERGSFAELMGQQSGTSGHGAAFDHGKPERGNRPQGWHFTDRGVNCMDVARTVGHAGVLPDLSLPLVPIPWRKHSTSIKYTSLSLPLGEFSPVHDELDASAAS